MVICKILVQASRFASNDWKMFKNECPAKYQAIKDAIKQFGIDKVSVGLDSNARPQVIMVSPAM
jgi:hypothetical protein